MKSDVDNQTIERISSESVSKCRLQLSKAYDKCHIPMVILNTEGFVFYSNPVAKTTWGSNLYSRGVAHVSAEPWEMATEQLWKEGLPREICLIDKKSFKKALLTPLIIEEVPLIAFKPIGHMGNVSVTFPYSINPMADWERVEEEIPLEESMADLYSVKGKISDGKFDTLRSLYKALIHKRTELGSLLSVYRNYGRKREKAVDIVNIIRHIGEETGVVGRLIIQNTANFCIGLEADEGMVALAVAECIRWLVPYMKRIGPEERITVKLFFYFNRVKIRFSVTRTDNLPELIKSNSGRRYFEGLQHIAGVIRTFGGQFESGVSISEMYLLWEVPFVKAQFESAMSKMNDVFNEAVIAEAVNGICYASRLKSDR